MALVLSDASNGRRLAAAFRAAREINTIKEPMKFGGASAKMDSPNGCRSFLFFWKVPGFFWWGLKGNPEETHYFRG